MSYVSSLDAIVIWQAQVMLERLEQNSLSKKQIILSRLSYHSLSASQAVWAAERSAH